MSKDQIFELPEEVEKNTLLILINPNKKEIAETVEQTNNALLSELQEYLQKEKSRHELEVTRIEKQYKGYVETLTIELEKNRKTVKKYKLIHEDVIKELKSTKILLTEERKIRLEIQEKTSKVTQEYEENLKRANSREDCLLRMLEEKDQKLSELSGIVTQLKSSVRSLEHEKQQIVDVVDEYKTELNLSNITRLNQELNLVKSLLEESEVQRHKLQVFISEIPESPSFLSSFMSPASIGSVLEYDSSESMENDPKKIEFMLEEFIKQNGPLNILKIRNNLFKIDGKEVSIYIKDGNLIGKVGKEFLALQEVLENDTQKTHRRGITLGCVKITDENEEIATVRGLKSPPESNFYSNKAPYKSFALQTTTPLRERNSNKRLDKKIPFR